MDFEYISIQLWVLENCETGNLIFIHLFIYIQWVLNICSLNFICIWFSLQFFFPHFEDNSRKNQENHFTLFVVCLESNKIYHLDNRIPNTERCKALAGVLVSLDLLFFTAIFRNVLFMYWSFLYCCVYEKFGH